MKCLLSVDDFGKQRRKVKGMDSAKLILGDNEYELPITVGSEGEVGIGIKALRGSSGAITLDSGYGNTGSCQSAITMIVASVAICCVLAL